MANQANETARLQSLGEALQGRQRLTHAAHVFFDDRGFLEVTTPLRIHAPALEDYIDAEPSGEEFLRASPELHMKRLLAAGYRKIYQLGPCFRKGERGQKHLPEFTMLEWYRAHADYLDILQDTTALVRAAAEAVKGALTLQCGAAVVDLAQEWEKLTVDEAFDAYANIGVDEAIRRSEFEQVLVEQVEPRLGVGRPTVLFDFPSALGSLARRHPENPERVQRWELYIAGIELANAYTELTDYQDQCRRFNDSAALRQRQGRFVYPLDTEYMQLLEESRLPPSGGIALGIDRLLMVLLDRPNIDDVVPFTPETM